MLLFLLCSKSNLFCSSSQSRRYLPVIINFEAASWRKTTTEDDGIIKSFSLSLSYFPCQQQQQQTTAAVAAVSPMFWWGTHQHISMRRKWLFDFFILSPENAHKQQSFPQCSEKSFIIIRRFYAEFYNVRNNQWHLQTKFQLKHMVYRI